MMAAAKPQSVVALALGGAAIYGASQSMYTGESPHLFYYKNHNKSKRKVAKFICTFLVTCKNNFSLHEIVINVT